MKNLLFLSASIFCSTCFGSGEWVPVNQPTVIVQEQLMPQPIIIERPVLRPTIIYQLTPHIVMEPIVTTKRRIFVKEETVRMIPVTKWIYQPVIVYR